MPPLSYRQVRDIYSSLKDAGLVTSSLGDWAKQKRSEGVEGYQAAENDNFIKRASVGLDDLLESTGVPESLGEFGGAVGSLVGNEEAGRTIGRGLLRTGVDLLPMAFGGPIGLGAAGLLTGAHTYAETDSPFAGLISGATTLAMPGAAHLAEQTLLRRMGAEALTGQITTNAGIQAVNKFVPKSIGQGLGAFTGGQIASSFLGEASSAAQAGVDPNQDYHFSPSQAFLDMTLGQLPFAGAYATKGGRVQFGGRSAREHIAKTKENIARTEENLHTRELVQQAANKTPIEQIPIVQKPQSPEAMGRLNQQLQALRERQLVTKKESTSQTPEEINALFDEENQAIRNAGGLSDNAVAGISLVTESTRTDMVGKEVFRNPTTGFRMIELPDGRRIGYSTKFEPEPTINSNGTMSFSVPTMFHSEFANRALDTDPLQPDLPVQKVAGSPDEWMNFIDESREADAQLTDAKSSLDFQLAIDRINQVRSAYGISPLSDKRIQQRRQVLGIDVIGAAKSLNADTRRQVARLRATAERQEGIGERARLLEGAKVEGADPLVVAEANDINQLESLLSQKGSGKFADMMVGGELNRRYMLWTRGQLPGQNGVPKGGGFDLLRNNVMESVKTGKGMLKSGESIAERVNKLPETPETLPLKQVVNENAQATKIEGDSVEVAQFRALVDEAGFDLNDITLEDAVDLDAALPDELQFGSPQDLVNFTKKPEVQQWSQILKSQVSGSAGPRPTTPYIPAGGGFVWGLDNYDPMLNRLGKHTIPKSGELLVSQFKNMGGRGKPLADAEIELARAIVPEAFSGDKVNVRELYKGLEGKAPQVEIKKLGELNSNKGVAEALQLMHELETKFGTGWSTVDRSNWDEEDYNKYLRVLQLRKEINTESPDVRYSFLGPKPESQMLGYVEGLVRVPNRTDKVKVNGPEGPETIDVANTKYRGPHFGTEDTNVLAFFRGYEETLPDGKKAFHLIEVQSDWEQARRKELDGRKDDEVNENMMRTKMHPLLRVYETLALKAAIKHARDIGAEAIVLSDGETAMMTEGHDKQLVQAPPEDWNGTNEEWLATNPGPPQSGGMRLHYDQILPNVLRKLTGGRGEMVDLGVHDKSRNQIPDAENNVARSFNTEQEARVYSDNVSQLGDGRWLAERPEQLGSPIFRNPDGIPKSNITGRLFPLDQAFANLDSQSGFTLFDKASAPQFKPTTEEQTSQLADLGFDRGSHGLMDFVGRTTTNPLTKAISERIRGFRDALDRVNVVMADDLDVPSRAGYNADGRTTTITFSPSLLMLPKELQAQEIVHEVTHALTLAELRDPTKEDFRSELDSIRQTLREALPVDMKEAIRLAEENGFIKRYNSGQAEFNELHPDYEKANILYALMNNDELVAQAYSSIPFQKLLKSTKGKVSTTLWSRFVSAVKKLFGFDTKVDNTMLGQMIEKTDSIMDRTNQIATFQNYAERFFENQGYHPAQAKRQAQRAMSLAVLSKSELGNKFHIVDLLARSEAVLPGVKGPNQLKAQKDVETLIRERDEDYGQLLAITNEQGVESSIKGLNELMDDALVNGTDVKDTLALLPDAAANYIFQRLAGFRDTLSALSAATSDQVSGLVGIGDVSSIRKNTRETIRAIDKLSQIEAIHDQAVKDIQGLFGVTPDGFLEKMLGMEQDTVASPRLPSDEPKEKGLFKRGADFLDYMFRPATQYAEPTIKEAATKGVQMQSNARKMATEAIKPLGIENGDTKPTHDSIQKAGKEFANPKLARARDGWIWEQQKRGQENGETKFLPASDPSVAPYLKNLSSEERQVVESQVRKSGAMNQIMQKEVLEKVQILSDVMGARVAQAHGDLKLQDNIALSSEVRQAIGMDWNDPIQAQQAEAMLANVQQRIGPAGLADLIAFHRNEKATYDSYAVHFATNPDWVTAQRYGEYVYKFFNKDGKPEVHGADSRKEAEEFALEHSGSRKLASFEKRLKPGDEESPYFGGDVTALIQAQQEKLTTQLDILRNAGMSEDELQTIRDTSPVTATAREAAAQGLKVEAPERTLGRGAKNLPFFSNQLSWVHAQSRYWSRKLFRAQMDALIGQKENTDEIKSNLRTYRDNLLMADPEVAQKTNNFIRTWFMGFNLATAMMNATQPFVTHVGELTGMTGKVGNSYKRVLSALKEVTGRKFGNRDWRDPEIGEMMKRALADGEVGLSKYDEDAAINENAMTNFKALVDGKKVKTLGQRASTMWGQFANASMGMFQQVEQVNNQVALITGYKLAREQGMNPDDAYKAAVDYNHRVNFGGGKAARPVGLYSSKSPVLRGAAMLASAMQSYVLGTTFQLARQIKNGVFAPKNATPGEKYAARKALVQILGTQFAAAGALGLPFASSALSLLEELFPDAEPNKKVRENVQQFFGEDAENGNLFTDIAMTGLPSMMGWDMQSRLSMGNTLPGVSEINGFQPEALMGPATNLVKDFVQGTSGLVSGDAKSVRKLVPSALKKLTSLAFGEGEVEDYKGRRLFTPTAGEQIGMALGFNPKRLSDINAASRMDENAKRVENRREGMFRQQLAEQALQGDFGSVKSALMGRANEDKEYDVREAIMAVSNAAEELAFPRDLRRDGGATRLLNLFNIPTSTPLESARLRFRTQIRQSLGLAVPTDAREMRLAQVMDQLREMRPEATRLELRRAAELQLRTGATTP